MSQRRAAACKNHSPLAVLAAVLATMCGLPASAINLDQEVDFNIPAQELGTALIQFSRQARVQVIVSGDIRGETTEGVKGLLAIKDALNRLLARAGLSYQVASDTSITVGADRRRGAAATKGLRLAQAETSAAAGEADSHGSEEPEDAGRENGELRSHPEEPRKRIEEVVVLGTHIRGAEAPPGSKVLVVDRAEIERAGYSTAPQILQTLPQNFRGDAAEHIGSTQADAANVSSGTGVNLRGLGSSATLVLLNGRRLLQSGGALGDFVDISAIPVTAIDRVEVLTDGASAIYGSDAIAGVVNFVLRDSYEGAETRVRYGGATEGNMRELQVGQAFGTSWNSGNVLLSYEYYDRDNLAHEDRDFANDPDLRRFGGDNFGSSISNPGTIVAPVLAAIPRGQDGTSLTPDDLLIGQSHQGNAFVDRDLLPTQETHNIFLTSRQRLTDSLESFGEVRLAERKTDLRTGIYSARALRVPDTNPYFVTPEPGATEVRVNYQFVDDFPVGRHESKTRSGAAVLGATLDLPAAWKAQFSALLGKDRVQRHVSTAHIGRLNEALGFDDPQTPFNPAIDGYFNVFGEGSNTAQNVRDYVYSGFSMFDSTTELRAFDIKTDGNLLDLPGGTMKLAVGAEYREEGYEREVVNFNTTPEPEISPFLAADMRRDVTAIFGEIRLPLFGEPNARVGLQRLQLSGALRYEEYSDVGSASNPKLGLLWSPVKGLSLRGTYGTSFKAPRLDTLVPFQASVAVDVPDVSAPDRTSLALLLFGNDPNLGPEESTAWTAGFNLEPAALRGFSLDATYYDIEFEDRIGIAGTAFTALLQPDIMAAVITRDPDDAVVQAYLDSPSYLPGFPKPPASDVVAIINGQISNLARTDVNGIDVDLSWSFTTGAGAFVVAVNGNYMFHFEEAILASAPSFDLVDTVDHPVDLRLRGSISWQHAAWSAALFVNHADSYVDTVSTPQRRIDSWTTVDLNVSYDFPVSFGALLAGTAVSLNVQNVADEDPPFVNNPAGVAYDEENATPLGRFMALNLVKRW